jgi:hypothetical protein
MTEVSEAASPLAPYNNIFHRTYQEENNSSGLPLNSVFNALLQLLDILVPSFQEHLGSMPHDHYHGQLPFN